MSSRAKFRFRFLFDEDLHGAISHFLKKEGQDVLHIPKEVKNGSAFRMAIVSRRTLLSGDSDFMNSAIFPPRQTKGLVVVKIHPQDPALIILVLKVLLTISPKRIKGKLVVLELSGVRIL